MFGGDISDWFFKDPFFGFPSNQNVHQTHAASFGRRASVGEQRSHSTPRDIFDEFSRAADELFNTAVREILHSGSMHRRNPSPFWCDHNRIPLTSNREYGINLNGQVVQREVNHARLHRHPIAQPVQYNRSRLQWYDSNTRRPIVAAPPSPPQSLPSGKLTNWELSKLPLSTYYIKPAAASGSTSATTSAADSSPIPVANNNAVIANLSPGSAYLVPVSRTPSLVEIQPILSSPSRGQPECEVCLTEYRNKDQLRHLPCGHAYHAKCIDVWFTQTSTCPKCRAGVRTGLRKLERLRNTTNSRVAAPVRAIRIKHPTKSSSRNGSVNRNQGKTGTQKSTPSSNTDAKTVKAENGNDVDILSTALDKASLEDRTSHVPVNNHIMNSSSSSDLSQVVRRKAAEAAIRRAEQAARERAQANEHADRS